MLSVENIDLYYGAAQALRQVSLIATCYALPLAGITRRVLLGA